MHHLTKAILLAAVVRALQACSTTVQPGQRGLRWYPLTEGLTPDTLRSGVYWRAPWNQINEYNVRWRRHSETVEALSSDKLPIALKTLVDRRPIPEELYFLVKEIGPILASSNGSCWPPSEASFPTIPWTLSLSTVLKSPPKWRPW